MMMRNRKVMTIVTAVVVVAGIAVWRGSRSGTPPAARFAPGEVVIEDSEMSPRAFAERRRQMVESRRAGAGAGAPTAKGK
jgi:hypothetical protein